MRAQVLIMTVTVLSIQAVGSFAAVPIVDGPDWIADSTTLTIVRENYFDTVDLSELGLLDFAIPVDQFSPNPPPMGSPDATKVQSLLVRSAWEAQAATIQFSDGVEILGVVTDIFGTTGDLWGGRPELYPEQSQLLASDAVFGVGGGYSDVPYRPWDIGGDIDARDDAFVVDRGANTVTLSALAPSGADDIRIILAFGDEYAPNEYMDVEVTQDTGLNVGAEHLGDGTTFTGIPLTTPEPGSLGLLALLLAAGMRRSR